MTDLVGTDLFRDAELHEIRVAWHAAECRFLLSGVTLVCRAVVAAVLDFSYPWGRGRYVDGGSIENQGEDRVVTLQMQSGDVLTVRCKHVEVAQAHGQHIG